MNIAYCIHCGPVGTKYDMNHCCLNCGQHVWFEKVEQMTLKNDQFDKFVEACENPGEPNEAMKRAADTWRKTQR